MWIPTASVSTVWLQLLSLPFSANPQGYGDGTGSSGLAAWMSRSYEKISSSATTYSSSEAAGPGMEAVGISMALSSDSIHSSSEEQPSWSNLALITETCPKYRPYPFNPPYDPEDGDIEESATDIEKRASFMERRWQLVLEGVAPYAPPTPKLAGTKTIGNVGTCTGLRPKVRIPSYPFAEAVFLFLEGDKQVVNQGEFKGLKDTPCFYKNNEDICNPVVEKLDKDQARVALDKSGAPVSFNTDHIYEVKLVANFIASRLGSDFDCADLEKLFWDASFRARGLWSQIASLDHADEFMIMEQKFNRLKGQLFHKTLDLEYSTLTGDDQRLAMLSDLGTAFELLRRPEISPKFALASNRILQFYRDLDTAMASDPDLRKRKSDASKEMPGRWADAYNTSIRHTLADQANYVGNFVLGKLDRIRIDNEPLPADSAAEKARKQPLHDAADLLMSGERGRMPFYTFQFTGLA